MINYPIRILPYWVCGWLISSSLRYWLVVQFQIDPLLRVSIDIDSLLKMVFLNTLV